jgi:hypothetical protein
MPGAEIPLRRLQNNCSVTLDRLVETARATCEMIGTLRKLPVSKDRRLAIYLQRKREGEAMAAYQKAARELLGAIEIQPDLLPDSEPVPLSTANGRGARLKNHRRV